MKSLKRLYYKIIPTYKRLELACVPYITADRLIKQNVNKPKSLQWGIAQKEEDQNRFGAVTRMVWLERRERILE